MPRLSNKIILDYQNKGWVKIKNFIKKNEVKILSKKISSIILNDIKKNKKKSRHINFATSNNDQNIDQLNSFHKLDSSNWIKKFAKRKNFISIVKSILGSKPELRASEFFAKPARVGLPAPIHQDNYYWAVAGSNALTIWVALNDSNRKNGGVFYYEGSHKYGILDHKPSFAKGSSQTIKNKFFLKKFKKVFPSLKKGDAIIHHTLVVHGSENNNSKKSRKGWTMQYKDKLAEYDYDQIKKYEKSLNYQIKLRGKNRHAGT